MSTLVSLSSLSSPLGRIWLASTDRGICGIKMKDDRQELEREVSHLIHDVVFTVDEKANEEGTKQLGEYFRGVRKRFQIPLDLRGTRFHQDVWRALQEIPYGETRSYKEIAEAISNPKAVRAVGQANGRNPVPIVVPCHRVIRHDGGLGGFGGGLHLKEQLLALEARHR